MSGTDAAATLSLKIDTHGARADLEALKNEYIALRAAMREGLPKLGGSSGQTSTLASQFKDVQASLSAVSAGVHSVNKALDDIVAAGGKFSNVLVRGAKEAVRQNALLTNSYTGVSAASATAAKSAVDYNALMGSAGKSISSLVKTNALLTDSLTSVSTVASAAGKSVVQYNSLMGTAAPAVAALVKTNALLTDSLTSVSTVASAAGKSVVQYNSLMGTAAPAVAALVKTNALLTDSLTSVSTVASAAGKSVVQYNSLMGTAAPAVAALVKTNALLTDSLTSVSTVASAAGKSVVQYNSLMGTAAPAVAALVKTNALLTDSLTSVSTVASAAGKSVVQYNSLMGTAAPAVAALVKTNALLTDSLTSVSTVASAAGKSVVQYNSLMGTAAPAVAALVKTNALLTDSLTSVSTVASAAGKSVVQYNSLMGTAAPAVAALVKTNALLTDSLTSVSTVASAAGKSVVQYNSLMGTAAPAVAALVKTNALLTDSLTSVSTVASAAGKSVVQYNSLMGTAAPAVAALVKTNALLTDSLTSVSTVASAAGKSVVQYNSLMGTAAPAVAALVKTNALLTDSLTSVSTVASAAGKSVVQYNSLMGTAAPAVAALVKTNALLTDSLTSVSTVASAAGKSVVQYNSLMGTAAPAVAALVKTNALLTDSLTSVSTVASAAGKSVVQYNSLMGTAAPAVAALVKTNALLTDSLTSVSTVASAAGKSVVQYNSLMGTAAPAVAALVKTNALLTDSLTSVSTVASAAGKSVVQYNSLMGTAAPAVAALVKTNALLTDSLTSVSTVASAAGKSVVQYNSLMGTAAPAVAALVKTNALLTDSLTSVSTVASAAGKSVVQYNSLMGTAAPAVAALVKTNALLTDSLTSVSTVASAAGKSVVQYNSLMGTAAPAVAALVKTNALLTDSLTSVSTVASAAGKSVVQYNSLMGTAAPAVAALVKTNALLTDSFRSVSAAASVAGKSVGAYDSLMNIPSVRPVVQTNALLTSSIVSSATASVRGPSATRYDPMMNTLSASLPAAIASVEGSHGSLASATDRSAKAQTHWNKVANEAHAAARGLAGSLGTLWITYGSLVPLLTGAALGSAFVNTAKAGSEFSYQLTFVKALGNESAEAVERLSNAATMLGQNSLQGPVELASGFRILAQAGLSGADSILAMNSVLDLAVVGEMDMAQAGTTLVGVMNAFGLSVTSASHVGDVFAKAAALSQTSVQGMTEAMKTASVVGEQYGATLEDTATAITLLAKVNITGTAAGTSFRNMLKELYAPTAGAAGVIKQLGLETSDAEGKLKSFPDIIYSLRSILEDYNKQSQVNILQKLFGERGAKEAIAMLALTRDEWDKLNGSISNSSGFMRQVASELESTTKGVFSQALNALKTGFVDTFNKTEGPMKDMAIRLKTLFSSPEFNAGLAATVGFMAQLASTALSAASALSILFNAVPNGTGTLALMAASVGAVTLSLSYLTAKVGVVAAGLSSLSAASLIAKTSFSSLSVATLAALSPMAPLYVAVGVLTAAYVLFNSKTPESINSINALNSALDTQITRLQVVNSELTKKIGLEAGSAANDTAAVRKELVTGKAQLAEYDRLLAADLESKRTGKTTVLGDMARNLFTTDEKEREEFAKIREARVRRSELATRLAEAEQKLRIAEGYEDQIRINSAKSQVQELLKQQESESKMATGSKTFVGENSTAAAKEANALFKAQTDEIVKGYKARVDAENTEFNNYKQILDQRVKYGAISQGAENVLLEQAQSKVDARTSSLREAEKQELQTLLASKDATDAEKISMQTRIDEIDAIQKSSEAKRAHILVLNQEKDALKQLSHVRKLENDIAEFAGKEKLSRDKAVSMDTLRKTSNGETIAAVEAYYATLERGQTKLKEYEAAIRDAESMVQSLVVSKTDDIKVTKKQRDELQWSINTQEAVTKAIGDGVVVTRKQYDELQKSINIQEAFSAATRDTADSSLAQSDAMLKASESVEVATESYNKYKAALEEQAQANATLTESLKGPEESLKRMQAALSASFATMDATLNARSFSGFYTTLEGLRAEGNINKEKISQLAEMKAAYEAMGAAGAAAAQQIEAQMIELSAHLDPVADKIRGIFENAFTTFFEDVLNGTKSIKEAFKDLGKSILKEFVSIVAKEASQQLMKVLGGGLKPGESQGLFSFLGNLLVGNGADSVGTDIAATGRSVFDRLKNVGGGGSLGTTLQSIPMIDGGLTPKSMGGLQKSLDSLSSAANDSVMNLSSLSGAANLSVGSFSTLEAGMQTFGASSAFANTGLTSFAATTGVAETSMAATSLSTGLVDVSMGATAASAEAAALGLTSVATASTTESTTGFLSSLAGLFAANGYAFEAGGTKAFAAGGTFTNSIVNSPTAFRFSSGGSFKPGVMGEDGPEAIIPLARGKDGKLGIASQGSGQPINITVHVNGNSTAPDVRRSAAQGAREGLSVLNGARRYG